LHNAAHEFANLMMKRANTCFCGDKSLGHLPRDAGRGLIWLYRHSLSMLVGANCRHLPTCSAYGDEALGRFGLWAGGWMTLARLLRCNPWGTSGIDNVPLRVPATARWYLPWRYARWRGTNV
jgi:putative membrane protein insertion efficiency factor